MMKSNKKVAFIVALLCFCVLLVIVFVIPSFDRNNDTYTEDTFTEEYYVPESVVYEDNVSEPISDGMPDGITYKIITTNTILDTKTASRLSQKYPLFEGIGSLSDDLILNTLISDILKEKQRIYGQGLFKTLGTGAKIIYDISDFEITYIDENFLSIVFEGLFVCYQENDTIDTGDLNFRFSVNLDLKEKQQISANLLLIDFLQLKNLFISGKMKLEYGQTDLLNNTSYIDMFSQFSSMYSIYPSFYFSKDKMMMIIPLTNDLGGNAVFSCSINDSRAFLNVYNSATLGLFS